MVEALEAYHSLVKLGTEGGQSGSNAVPELLTWYEHRLYHFLLS